MRWAWLLLLSVTACVRSTTVDVEPVIAPPATTSVVGAAPGPCPVFASGREKPRDIAVDASYVYWVDMARGVIARAPKDDSGAIEDLVREGPFVPQAFALDGGHVYWTTPTGIFRIAKRGGPIEPVAVDQHPWSSTLGVFESKVLWGNRIERHRGKIVDQEMSFMGTSKDGAGSVTTLWRPSERETFTKMPSSIVSIGKTLYFVTESGRLMSGTLDGPITDLAQVGALYPKLAVDTEAVYVATFLGRRVLRVPKEGGPPAILHEGVVASSIAVHGDRVLFTDSVHGELLAIPKTGGAPSVLCNGLENPLRIAVDDKAAWITSFAGGTVSRYPL